MHSESHWKVSIISLAPFHGYVFHNGQWEPTCTNSTPTRETSSECSDKRAIIICWTTWTSWSSSSKNYIPNADFSSLLPFLSSPSLRYSIIGRRSGLYGPISRSDEKTSFRQWFINMVSGKMGRINFFRLLHRKHARDKYSFSHVACLIQLPEHIDG